MQAVNPGRSISFTIVSFVSFTFIGYFTIGLALAVLPVFIHQVLGFNTMIAGVVISLQYITTFVMRGYAGSIVDKKGPKPAVIMGMVGFGVSGVSLFVAYLLRATPALSLSVLVLARLMTGFGEGLVGSSPINWAIFAVGDQHTAKAISFNGIASYGALAAGAPIGVILNQYFGLGSIGILIIATGIVGFLYARNKVALKGMANTARHSFFKILKTVSPFGVCLALAGIGFGTISTFITLYYDSLNWSGAVLCLSVFSMLFILGRIVFANSIDTYGGLQTAIMCLALEALGLFILWKAESPHVALIGAGFSGLGFSLIFPALGVEAVRLVPTSNQGSALGGYGLFIDLSLGITGPLVGSVASNFGMSYIFPFSMGMVLLGFVTANLILLIKKKREPLILE
jgi:MFS family permease